jgi:hypothetical protein
MEDLVVVSAVSMCWASCVVIQWYGVGSAVLFPVCWQLDTYDFLLLRKSLSEKLLAAVGRQSAIPALL